MRDLDFSLGFNYSRFNSNNWQNLQMDEASQEMSLLSKPQTVNNQSQFHFQSLLNEPPRPITNIYNCIESLEPEQNDEIKEVEYIQSQPEAKSVNSKQYFRMMKRRIKKVMNQYTKNENQTAESKNDVISRNDTKGRQYIYESRHLHASRRKRGEDGKFLATRPESQRFREKKKRGRKPKNHHQNNGQNNVSISKEANFVETEKIE